MRYNIGSPVQDINNLEFGSVVSAHQYEAGGEVFYVVAWEDCGEDMEVPECALAPWQDRLVSLEDEKIWNA